MEAAAREPTAVLEVDGGLRLRLGVDLLVELSVLRLRIAAAFAAKVGTTSWWPRLNVKRCAMDECSCYVSANHRSMLHVLACRTGFDFIPGHIWNTQLIQEVVQVERPSEALPPAAEAALQVAARVFAFESRMQNGGSVAALAPAPHTQLLGGRGRSVLSLDRTFQRRSSRRMVIACLAGLSSCLPEMPCVNLRRGGQHSHSEHARGRSRAPSPAGRGGYASSRHAGAAGGSPGFAPAGLSNGARVQHAERGRGRGHYVPPSGNSARNPYAAPPPANGGRGRSSSAVRGRGRTRS